MTTHRHSTPPAGTVLLRTLISLVLVGLLTACGGGEEPPGERNSTRTGGIFGGTTSPTSERGPSPETAPASPEPSTDVRGEEAPRTPRSPASGSSGGSRIDISGLGHTAGSADAPIQVIEFSDFGCGYCRKFHVETYPTIREEYIETGKVVWKYIPFVLGMFPNGAEAARAGECAIAQDEFPPLRDRLFADQKAWREADQPVDVFVRLAREEGLDAERFRTCYVEKHPEERVRRNIQVGQQVGVRGTPTFLIQGHPVQGALPMDVFREIFDQVLESRSGSGSSGGGSGP